MSFPESKIQSKLVLLLVLFGLLIPQIVSAQLETDYITGAKKNKLDTFALEASRGLAKESTGLLEKEIDPEEYVLGPNDKFQISIVTSEPQEIKAKISSEGILVIPSVGGVQLKGKTLAEGKKLIIDKINNVYRASEISVTISEIRMFKVIVGGTVMKPITVPATAADRVSEVIEKAGGFKYDASIRRIILKRENQHIPVDLVKFYNMGDKSSNPTVLGGDHIIVPTNDEDNSIEIFGEVASPAEFEFVPGDSLSSLIGFALGFFDSAMLDSVVIARIKNKFEIDRIIVDLSSWRLDFNTGKQLINDMPLKAGDRVFIRKRPETHQTETVALMGEVTLPGYYAINKQVERVYDLISMAGGFTKEASYEGAVLIRQKELDKQDEEMERLGRTPMSEMSENEKRYFSAKIREKKGVMAIDFRRIVDDPTVEDNIILEDKDSIYVPMKKIFINVQGRVNNPGLVVYNSGFTYLDYINLAGGLGFRADEGEILVVKQGGEQFLAESMNYTLEPGDNILVPPEQESSFWEILTEGLTVAVQIASIAGLVVSLMAISKQ